MENTKQPTISSRNYGLDLLRIVIGFMVIVGHSLYIGGLLNNVPKFSLNFKVIWLIEAWVYCCPNTFIMISGYTSVSESDKKQDWSKLIVLWLEVIFYSVVFTVIYTLYIGDPLDFSTVIRSFFPLMNYPQYWFFASYLALFIFKPFIDKGIKAIDEHDLKIMFFIIIAVFSFYTMIADPFFLKDGVTPFWFIILYILGAITKKCSLGEKISIPALIAILCGLILITWLFRIYDHAFLVMDHWINYQTLYSYISPTITGCAIVRVILYSKIKPKGFIRRIVLFTAPSVFTIYLLNTHPVYWNRILPDKFAELAPRRLSVLLPPIFIYSACFFTASILIDKIRQFIFRKLRIRERVYGLLYSGNKNKG